MKDTPQRDNLNAAPKQLPDVFEMRKGTRAGILTGDVSLHTLRHLS
jgi:hypothetical protein